MRPAGFFGSALRLLLRQPRLFLPKLVVAALFGMGMLLTARMVKDALSIEALSRQELYSLFSTAIFLLLYTLAAALVDIIVNAMYPVMVENYNEKKQVSLSKALLFAFSRAKTVIPADIAVLLLFALIVFPLNYLIVFFRSSGNALGFFVSALLLLFSVFVLVIGFYWLYPVATLEKAGIMGTLKRTVFLSRKNLKRVSIASVFPFVVSLINIFLAFFYDNPAFLALFVLMRFFTAVVYTYHLVLSPTLYLGLVERERQ